MESVVYGPQQRGDVTLLRGFALLYTSAVPRNRVTSPFCCQALATLFMFVGQRPFSKEAKPGRRDAGAPGKNQWVRSFWFASLEGAFGA
jgi:hypothetical protein